MFWFLQIDKIKNFKIFKYNLFAICSLLTLNKNSQDKLIVDNIKLFVEKIIFLIEKIDEKIQKEEKKENKKINNEEDDEDDLDRDDLFKKLIVEGKEISDDDDEDDDWEEDEDEEEFPETEVDKQDPILIVKNSFDIINKAFPELFNNIIDILGNKVNKLKDIFSKREEYIKLNSK